MTSTKFFSVLVAAIIALGLGAIMPSESFAGARSSAWADSVMRSTQKKIGFKSAKQVNSFTRRTSCKTHRAKPYLVKCLRWGRHDGKRVCESGRYARDRGCGK